MSSNTICIKNGMITQDPEMKSVGSTVLLTLNVATNKVWKDRDTGETKKKGCFHEIKLWGKDAEEAYEKAQKYGIVTCWGSLEMESWKDKATGQNRHKHIVSVDFPCWDNFIILPPRQRNDQQEASQQRQGFHPIPKKGNAEPDYYNEPGFLDNL